MKLRGYRKIFCAAGIIGLAVGILRGQLVNGTILGTVQDASGGVIPMARVSASNIETGVARSTLSDSSGAAQLHRFSRRR